MLRRSSPWFTTHQHVYIGVYYNTISYGLLGSHWLAIAMLAAKNMFSDLRFFGPVLVTLLVVFLVIPSPTSREEMELTASAVDRADSGTQVHKEVMEGHDVLWQMPSGKAKGLLFVAHGCNHQGTDFWPASKACPDCLGLPEEMLIREAALSLGYAVVAVSSLDRTGSRCWDVKLDPQKSKDGPPVAAILKAVRAREGLGADPVYALGVSSGGAFVLMLPHLMQVQGVCAQIAGAPPQLLKLGSGAAYPPTLFVHMPRDGNTAAVVGEGMKILQGAGVSTAEIRVDPRPVTPEFLSSRSQQISAGMAASIVESLRKGGLLGAEGGPGASMLLKDPRRVDWQSMLTRDVPGIKSVSLVPDASPVSELLNLAWAGHEIVSDYTRVGLAWMAAGGRSDVEQLIKTDHGVNNPVAGV